MKQNRGFHGQYGEDNWTPQQRMEHTSRIETRLENDEKREEGAGDGWLAATESGEVKHMQGEPNAAALGGPGQGENDIEALRRNRIEQMKTRAAQRQHWTEKGQGVYHVLADEAELLKRLAKHERAVVLFSSRSGASHLSELMHAHMRSLSVAHFESFFGHLDSDKAPMIQTLIEVSNGPILLLCMGGKVTGQLAGIDRSYTAEGIAYELGLQGLLNFDDGIQYGKSAGGCTTATARRAAPQSDESDDYDE